MTQLSVNLNKIALIRNSRGGAQPNVVEFALRAIEFGAHGITVHPRPDGRHIRRDDVFALKDAINVELNIEGYPSEDFNALVREVKPAQVTLVPDDPAQLTSDHGWDLEQHGEALKPIIDAYCTAGIRVSLFMDPVAEKIAAVKNHGADRIELYTEAYAKAYRTKDEAAVLQTYVDAAQAALDEGLGVNAGHDLNQANLGLFCSDVPNVSEVSIGHALVSEALVEGWKKTIQNYISILQDANS